ncbi:hypothetical protein BDW74DRAFT_182330 [Aspergillus multicolor]|uniref:uncharacterized protein n=1 Tax=Aspergillus multicolor TaxID=41759 RepID=UPI003CCCA793
MSLARFSTTAKTVIVGGVVMPDAPTLLSHLRHRAGDRCVPDAPKLHGRVFVSLNELAVSTIENFGQFKQTSAYKTVWKKMNDSLKNVVNNQRQVANARAEIIAKWGVPGREFSELNDSHGFAKYGARLAKLAPDYARAMELVVMAEFDRFHDAGRGKPL